MSARNSRADAEPVIGETLIHPIAITAVIVLLLNDHLLKARYPGLITGKLSDVAGLVFFPLLLLTLVDAARRFVRGRSGLTHGTLVACIVLTGLAFVAVKTTDIGAEAFRRMWGAMQWPGHAIASRRLVHVGRVHLVKDSSDLVAVPMLLVAYWVGRRVLYGHTEP